MPKKKKDNLQNYRLKRNFAKTSEPRGKKVLKKGKYPIFVVQKHAASHLHFDLRFEAEGALKSWAVPKGIPKSNAEKRLAMMVEDHPFDYRNFEGIIPRGNYGAGTVMVWDRGIYKKENLEEKAEIERYLIDGIKKGNFGIEMKGEKISGHFSLVKSKKDGEIWILIRKASDKQLKYKNENISVISGKTMEEIKSAEKYFLVKDLPENLKGKMPTKVKPMLAKSLDHPFSGKNWIFEIKIDGYRCTCEKRGKDVKLYSRNFMDYTKVFSKVVEEMRILDGDFILDGEVAVIEDGKINFQMLQDYAQKKRGFLVYYVFDILYLFDRNLFEVPLEKRKEILREFIPGFNHIKIVEFIETEGERLFENAISKDIEGIIAKEKQSKYLKGMRSNSWLKIKAVNTQEAVIAGYTEPRGTRRGFGALILGVYEKGNLVYIGHTGGGFAGKDIKSLKKRMDELIVKKSPFENVPKTNMPVTWIKPKIMCEVKFSEWTKEGILRHPIFLRIRNDKDPEEAVKEDKQDKSEYKFKIVNQQKILWPKDGYTKKDLINYYQQISEYILPHLIDRPQSLNRYPNGISEPNFYQKDTSKLKQKWLHKISIRSEREDREIQYLLCQNEDTLVYLANLGCIELNPWNSRINSLDNPDYGILDLDPLGIDLSNVVIVAREIKKLLDKISVDCYCKTSGATGLHIFIPMGAKYNYEQVKLFCQLIANIISKTLPDIASVKRSPNKRENKVYIDYLQNIKGQTIASVYSIRPRDGAPVSTPLLWKEVNEKLNPDNFNIKTIAKRLEKLGDIWPLFSNEGIIMEKALKDLQQLYSNKGANKKLKIIK